MSAVGPLHFSLLMKQFMDPEPKSRSELIAATGLHHVTISRYVEALRRQRVIRIDEYRRGGNHQWVPYFILNSEGENDVGKPHRKPREQVYAEVRARRREIKMHHFIAGKPQGKNHG